MVFKVIQRDFEEFLISIYKKFTLVEIYFSSIHKEGSSETDGTIRTEINKEYSFTDIFKTDAVADIKKFMKEKFIDKIPQEDQYWFKVISAISKQSMTLHCTY